MTNDAVRLSIMVSTAGRTCDDGYAKEDLKTRIPCGNNMAKVHILVTIKSDSLRQQPEHERIQLLAMPTDDAIHSSA